MNKPFKELIPAIPFIRVVASFAHAKGLPFVTLLDQLAACEIYKKEISKLN